jgi:ABC-2 type transport system permease protein
VTEQDGLPARVISDLRAAWAIARKDIRIYYVKPNIIVAGILFPLFMFLAFATGRDAPAETLLPGLIAITALFSSSTIEPVSIPIERRVKTFDRFLVAPISLDAIVLGESLSGFVYSVAIGFIPFLAGYLLFGAVCHNAVAFIAGLCLTSLCFSVMGTLFASYPTESPGDIMSMVNLVRLPLMFISGIFIPFDQMPGWGQMAGLFSPLSYAVDLIRYSYTGATRFGVASDIIAIAGFIVAFHLVSRELYRRFND